MKTLNFKCTNCGGNRLQEIASCNRIISPVLSVRFHVNAAVVVEYDKSKMRLDSDEIPIYEYRCADCNKTAVKGKRDGQQIAPDDLAQLFQ